VGRARTGPPTSACLHSERHDVCVILLTSTTVDLARAQFATTSLYHFLFVPLTLGLGPIVAVMQTLWHRTGNEAWLRLTRFFGTLFLINFAIGVATGLVQEFQFGMNWSVYSKFVGDVFGAPLAIEGLAAFFLESTFLGLWIFGWNRLSPRLHLATLWVAVIGTWLSAYFILVANSWMQRPVGYKLVDSNNKAELTSVWSLLSNDFALWAFGHAILAGLTTGAAVVFGVACWHLVRGRNVELFRRAAKVALIVLVPVASFNLWFGSHFGIYTTEYQPMKIAASEALWDTEQPASFSLFQIGGFSRDDQTPSFDIEVPRLLSFLADGSFKGKVQGMNPLQSQYEGQYGSGNYIPHVRTTYWSMRVMAYLGSLVALVALVGAFLFWKHRLEKTRWFLWTAVVTAFFPFIISAAGWCLTEFGRQPWIVNGLLKTADANSPSVSAWTIGLSLAAFVCLYLALLVLNFWLMRHYARLDPPETKDAGEAQPLPAVGY
jgi:cytochrome bd ubiquinol oxidase subunit I